MSLTWRRLAPVLCLSTLVAAGPTALSAAPPTARLQPGAVAFWDSDAQIDGPAQPSCAQVCQDFRVDLVGSGERLRVAADGDGRTAPTVEIYDAEGTRLAQHRGIYSAEAYVDVPDAGRYTVRVASSRGAQFRLRAKLERTVPGSGRSAQLLLPNLRLVPPYELTMDPPVSGYDLGCNPYEQAEYGAKRCLRFSLGPANTGSGPLMLEFPAMSGIVGPEPVYQLVKRTTGANLRRQAGTALWHKTHAHHHHNGFGSLELLRVTDLRRGTMVLAGRGPKQGFCMLDYLIADWRAFANAPAKSVRQDCSLATGPTATQIGLGAGWADIYTYGLDGNYVEFGTNKDGRYVVRSVADARNDILESDERDNAGYAYIEVRGNDIEVLERGRGTGPWDPRKQIVDDLLRSNA